MSNVRRLCFVLAGLGAIWFALAGLGYGQSTPAEAIFPGADNVSVTNQSCVANNRVEASLNWTSYSQGSQWLDLSLFDNGFIPTTFVGLGPLPAGQSSFAWSGLLAGYWHVLRVNTLTPYGWSPSQTISFFTRSDCQFVQPPSGATNVSVGAQTCLPDGRVEITVNWTSSGQGPQWIDLSLFNDNFAFGTFYGIGPFPAGQSSQIWSGLLPGYPLFLRVNTLTPSAWVSSQTVFFQTRADCQTATPTPTLTPVSSPTATPTSPPPTATATPTP